LRKAFVEALCDLAAIDKRILLLTGDLGYMALEPFRDRFPDRFINVGVAEQNLIGIATGLGEAGFIPYAYSIATFISLRPLEFIRNGPVLHRLPVRLVGMGMGFEYGHAGPTHHAVEDICVLRTMPGLSIVVPADSPQAGSAIRKTADLPGPIYYSLGKDDRCLVPGLNGCFDMGRIQVVRGGEDIAIVTMGSIAMEVVAAADELAAVGIEATVAVLSSFSPDPIDDLTAVLSRFECVISVEAQTVSGGLGAFVATLIASQGLSCRLTLMAVCSSPDGTSGNQHERWRKHHLDHTAIVRNAMDAIGAKR
jgi:transketolase